MNKNKTPEQIFNEEHLSARFYLYQKDTSKKGRSLYLSQFLQHLKREFPEFKDYLDETITVVRAAGSLTEDELEKRVLKAMRSFATTIEEIAEDTELDWWSVRSTLELMIRQGKARKEAHPMSDSYRDHLYFEIK